MSDQTGKLSSLLWSFALGGVAGALAAVMLVVLGNFGWTGAVFTGALLAVSVGLYLSVVLARPLPTMAEVNARITARPAAPVAAAPAPVMAAPVMAAPVAAAPAPVAAAVEAAPAAEVAPAPAPVVAKVAEPVLSTGAKPVFLSGARDGQADDLKLIKGVGPKLEQMLHGMGVFHFDQIATWSEAEVAWVDDNLEGFKGRVSRDGWVGQARTLAAGGTV